jgi:hypothetical protein
LANHYQTNFALVQHHNWNLSDLDEMLPFERQIYIILLQNWIKEENQRISEHNAKMKG